MRNQANPDFIALLPSRPRGDGKGEEEEEEEEKYEGRLVREEDELEGEEAFEDHAGDSIQFGSKGQGSKGKKHARETMSDMINEA